MQAAWRVLDPVTGHRVSPGRLEISSKGKWVKAFMQRLVKSGGGCGPETALAHWG